MRLTLTKRRALLERGIVHLEARADSLRRRGARVSWARLAVFFGGIALSLVAASVDPRLGAGVFLASIVIFGIMVGIHRRLEHSRHQMTLMLQIKRDHLARSRIDWEQIPAPLTRTADPNHPFEADLDVIGARSLHHLLDTTVTVEGSERLRAWLTTLHPDRAIIAARQALAQELVPRMGFRDKLALYGRLTSKARHWRSEALVAWVLRPIPNDGLERSLLLLSVLSAVNITLMLLNAAGVIPPLWVFSLIVYLGLMGERMRHYDNPFQVATQLQDTLTQTRAVFRLLEQYRAQTPRLRALCAPFTGTDRPTDALRRLSWIVSAASLQINAVLWGIVNTFVPWDVFVAVQLRRAQQHLQIRLPVWLEVWRELEATCALATFADLNPDYRTPDIADAPAVWEAVHMGHPLLPYAQRVTNTFAITGAGEVGLITGSNMSGKSTFLRTVGVNMILAYAGAVVPAERLRLSPLRLFTCIRIADSLAEGYSYFYAEVRRLKALLNGLQADEELPLFFLIDEIFRGTNNRERFMGSQAYIRALLGADAQPTHGMGLVSTHDLDLTRMTAARLHNYHFADRVVEGAFVFDYLLHDGPSYTTNALRIMALEGLPVPDTEST